MIKNHKSLYKLIKTFGIALLIITVVYSNIRMVYEVLRYEKNTVDITDRTSVSLNQPITYIDKPTIKNSNLTYSGKAQKPVILSSAYYTVSISPHTNVGLYTATVQLKDTETTKWQDDSTSKLTLKWQIKKANLRIIANNNNITYGAAPSNSGVLYEGFLGKDGISSLKGTLAYKYNYSKYNNVGTYTITPSGLTSSNYNIVYVSGKLIVSPKKLSFTWSSPSSFTYNGNTKHVYATISGTVNNDDVNIASYSQNSASTPGQYTAKVTKLGGAKSNNYTLSGSSNVSHSWKIVKNNSTNNSNNTETTTEITEATRIDNNKFVAKLGDGTTITAKGSFSDSIQLMVKSISSKEKIWKWIKGVTEDVGISKEAFDIFFVNNSGERINTGKGTKISILSSDRKQDIEVYYINSTGKKQKLKSTKEEYTVQFNMVENGYYTLLTSDQSLQLEKNQDGNITTTDKNNYSKDKDNNNSSKNEEGTDSKNADNVDSKSSDGVNSNDNKDKTDATNSKQGENEKTDDNSNITTDGNQNKENVDNNDSDGASVNITGDGSQDEEDTYSSKDNNWLVMVAIIFIIVGTVILFIIILKKQKNKNDNME